MKTSRELDTLIKQASPEVREYVAQLQAELRKLVKDVAKREVAITRMRAEFDELREGRLKSRPLDELMDWELEDLARQQAVSTDAVPGQGKQ